MNQEEHNRIVQAGLSQFDKPKDSTDIERLVIGCEARIKMIRNHIHGIAEEMRLGNVQTGALPTDPTTSTNRRLLLEDCQQKFLDLAIRYSKDELIMLMSIQWTTSLMREIV